MVMNNDFFFFDTVVKLYPSDSVHPGVSWRKYRPSVRETWQIAKGRGGMPEMNEHPTQEQ